MLLAFHKPFDVLSQFTQEHPSHRTLAEFGFPPHVYAIVIPKDCCCSAMKRIGTTASSIHATPIHAPTTLRWKARLATKRCASFARGSI
jgi:hypothetical protein